MKSSSARIVAMTIAALAVAGVLLTPGVRAESGVTKHGFVHNIADDRNVEKVGGIYEPEGMDKYMRRKFEQVYDDIARLEGKIDGMQSQLESIEDKLTKMSKG